MKYLRSAKHLHQTSLRRHLEELRELNHDLQRLLGFRALPDRTGRRKRRSAALRFLRRDFTHALDIYNAICNGYRCHCDRPHFANLKLPRLSNLEPGPNEGLSHDAGTLQLLFSVEDSTVTSTSPDSAICAAETQECIDEDSVAVEQEEELL
jgi:hypothetical protein